MGKIIESLSNTTNDNVDVQRRNFARRSTDICLVTIEGVPYPVKDWSLSGILFEADSRVFEQGNNLPMVIKFDIGDEVVDVNLTGKIVRKNKHHIATHFDPLPSKIQQTLHEIIDKSNSRNDEKSDIK
jgi:hypothetical protein